MRGLMFGGCLLVASSGAMCTERDAIQSQVEAGLVVQGTIDLDAAGNVVGYKINQAEKFDAVVMDLIEQTVPKWKFEPVSENGKVHAGKASMNLFVVASKTDAAHVSLRIRSADFEDVDVLPTDKVQLFKHGRLEYPEGMLELGVEGTVYLAVHVDRTGHVDLFAQQVNLKEVGTAASMNDWRKSFAQSTIKAVRRWEFARPTTGKFAGETSWTGILPVAYTIHKVPEYASWDRYVPGPKQQIPWQSNLDVSSSPEAMTAGEIGGVSKGPHLLTPLAGG